MTFKILGYDVLSLVGYASFFIIIFFYQKIQIIVMKFHAERGLKKLHRSYQEARNYLIDTFGEGLIDRIDELIEFIFIPPHDRDPAGIMKTLERNMKTAKKMVQKEVSKIMQEHTYQDVLQYSAIVEITSNILMLYKIVRHLIIMYKKFKIAAMVMYAASLMPLILEMNKAFQGALKCFRENLPIGDSIGSLIVSELVKDYGIEKWKLLEDCDILEAQVIDKGREITFARAREMTVGDLADYVRIRKTSNGYRLSKIISIDASIGFYGEPLGGFAKGVGVACGGSGVERRIMETVGCETTTYIVKMDIVSAYGEMYPAKVKKRSLFGRIAAKFGKKKQPEVDLSIVKNKDVIIERIKEEIEETKGDRILILGIGNAIGVPVEVE